VLGSTAATTREFCAWRGDDHRLQGPAVAGCIPPCQFATPPVRPRPLQTPTRLRVRGRHCMGTSGLPSARADGVTTISLILTRSVVRTAFRWTCRVCFGDRRSGRCAVGMGYTRGQEHSRVAAELVYCCAGTLTLSCGSGRSGPHRMPERSKRVCQSTHVCEPCCSALEMRSERGRNGGGSRRWHRRTSTDARYLQYIDASKAKRETR